MKNEELDRITSEVMPEILDGVRPIVEDVIIHKQIKRLMDERKALENTMDLVGPDFRPGILEKIAEINRKENALRHQLHRS